MINDAGGSVVTFYPNMTINVSPYKEGDELPEGAIVVNLPKGVSISESE